MTAFRARRVIRLTGPTIAPGAWHRERVGVASRPAFGRPGGAVVRSLCGHRWGPADVEYGTPSGARCSRCYSGDKVSPLSLPTVPKGTKGQDTAPLKGRVSPVPRPALGGLRMNATRFRWLASKDGEAHAVPARGRWVRTACGLPALDERMAWPERARCPRCLAALGFLP